MESAMILDDAHDVLEVVADAPTPRRRRSPRVIVRVVLHNIALVAEWIFGAVALILGLAILAALPVAQFLSMGYFLESSARVARSGRLRDGIIGVRRAARVGGLVAGAWLSTLPLWLAGSFARSADLIDPGGTTAAGWRAFLAVMVVLTFLHIGMACMRGARLRHFLIPFGNPFWLRRRLRDGSLYSEARDGLCDFLASLRLPRYFRIGLIGFIGTLSWLIVPAVLISSGGKFPLLGIIGVILLAVIVPFLPFLQVRYAVEGRISVFYSRRAIRDRFRRAPWAFAFALFVLLLASIPLYLLKIEMIPREAAWLPGLVFVLFLAPARLLIGWAYSRSGRRDLPRHWFFRYLGRLAIVLAALFYVMVVFFAQYTSWGGLWSLYEQHAFLLPVPFLRM